jgi:hypothetical protein
MWFKLVIDKNRDRQFGLYHRLMAAFLEFSSTCGGVAPIDGRPVGNSLIDDVTSQRHSALERLADDPRFAAAICRSALDASIMDARRVSGARVGHHLGRNGQAKPSLNDNLALKAEINRRCVRESPLLQPRRRARRKLPRQA